MASKFQTLLQLIEHIAKSCIEKMDADKLSAEFYSKLGKMCFIYSTAWSFGSLLNAQKRKEIVDKIRGFESIRDELPDESIFEVFIECSDNEIVILKYRKTTSFFLINNLCIKKWKNWSTVLEEKGNENSDGNPNFVLTADSMSLEYLIAMSSLYNDSNTLLVGPSGSGKSAVCNYVLGISETYGKISENLMLSGQMSGAGALSLITAKIEKRRKGIYGPPIGKKLSIFLDDLSSPKVETYGAQPALEMVRQLIDIRGW